MKVCAQIIDSCWQENAHVKKKRISEKGSIELLLLEKLILLYSKSKRKNRTFPFSRLASSASKRPLVWTASYFSWTFQNSYVRRMAHEGTGKSSCVGEHGLILSYIDLLAQDPQNECYLWKIHFNVMTKITQFINTILDIFVRKSIPDK